MDRSVIKGLKKSKALVGPLHRVILDAEGNIVAGEHRKAADPDWPEEVRPEIKTERDRVLVRIHENYRKDMPHERVKEELLRLAEILIKEERIHPRNVCSRICEMVPYTSRYVRKLLPAMYKPEREGNTNGTSSECITLAGGDFKVYCKSSEDMSEVEAGSVHLTVTSPPYNANKPYDVYQDNKSIPEYRNLISKVLAECYRKLVSGGRIAVVVPIVMKVEGETIFMPLFYAELLKEQGYLIRDAVIWQKSEGLSIPEGTAWGSWCSPRNPVMRSIAEFILIAHKEVPDLEGEHPDIQSKEFKEWTKNVWIVPPVSSEVNPSVFPEKLVQRLIKLYSYLGQTVLDPFCGIGSTGVACVNTNRKFVGYDISSSYCDEARRRIGDARSNVEP